LNTGNLIQVTLGPNPK